MRSKSGLKKTLDEAEAMAAMASFSGSESSTLKVYGGSASAGKVAKKQSTTREKLLKQLANLDEQAYVSLMGHVNKFEKSHPLLKSGRRSESGLSKTKGGVTKLTGFIRNIETVLSEHVGNTKGGVNAVVNLKYLEEAMAADLTASEIEKARALRSDDIFAAVEPSIGEMIDTKKARSAVLKPAVPASYAPSAFGAANSLHSPDAFLEYEQPLTPWEHDHSMMPDLDSALNVTPLRKSHSYKFVLISIDSQATEGDIRKAVAEACDQSQVTITDIEIFNDLVANKQRRHAFVAVSSLGELQNVLNDRVRAFGVHINGQRSSIVDVEEKNIISIMTRPAMDPARIETLLKDLGVMNLVTKDAAAPTEPIISSFPLHQSRPNRFSIFAPRDGNGELIGKAWISFPSHASAYAAYHSLVAARPGSIRAYWSQKSPNHFEEAIRLRDALAAENAELRQKMASLSDPVSEADTDPTEDQLSLDSIVSKHILRVLGSARGSLPQTAKMLDISEKSLQVHIKRIRAAGHDVQVQDTRGRTKLTASRD